MDDYCKYVYYGAAKSGNLALFQQLKSQGYPFSRQACRIAAEHGHLSIIQWILQEIKLWEEEAQDTYEEWLESVICTAAAKNGHLHILKAMPKMWMGSALEAALFNGKIEILNYLKDNNLVEVDRTEWLHASVGNLDSMIWLTNAYLFAWNWDVELMRLAVSAGNMNVLKYLKEKNCAWDSSVCAAAAVKENFDVLKWLHENGCPWDHETMEIAAKCGNLKMVQYLIENRCPFSPDYALLIEYAVKGGNLELIKLLQSKLNITFQDESNLCTYAIRYQYWDVLRYLLDLGCETDGNTMILAVKTPQISLETLIELYNPDQFGSFTMLQTAAANGRKDFINWFSQYHNSKEDPSFCYKIWDHVVLGAIEGNQSDLLKTAFINCTICTEDLSIEKSEPPLLFKWLQKQGCK